MGLASFQKNNYFYIKLIMQAIGFLLALVILAITYWVLLRPEIIVNQKYQPVLCMITAKQLEEFIPPAGGKKAYRPNFQLSYTVAGQHHLVWAYSIVATYSPDQAQQQTILQRYPVGQFYTCWYDPYQPEKVVLARGYSPFTIAAVGLTLFIVLVLAFPLLIFGFKLMLRKGSYPGNIS